MSSPQSRLLSDREAEALHAKALRILGSPDKVDPDTLVAPMTVLQQWEDLQKLSLSALALIADRGARLEIEAGRVRGGER